MFKNKIYIPVVLIALTLNTSCGQSTKTEVPKGPVTEKTKIINDNYAQPHAYGGWYCPDNFGGFPPINIVDYKKVAVVTDRLPTLEETGNGTSLMHFDTTIYPEAKPLDLDLPRVAKIYSEHTGINELIVIIQAATIGTDSVVGFRYPNGGNGTAWLRQVQLLSNKELDNLESSPMVYYKHEINATTKQVWEAISNTDYVSGLVAKFGQESFFKSEWTNQSKVKLAYESENELAKGIIADMWGNLYAQIDYNLDGFHYTEKILVLENTETNTVELHVAIGPFVKDFEQENERWGNWVEEIESACNGE